MHVAEEWCSSKASDFAKRANSFIAGCQQGTDPLEAVSPSVSWWADRPSSSNLHQGFLILEMLMLFSTKDWYLQLPISFNLFLSLYSDAECFLVDGLQNENLSPRAREQRNTILYGFQQARARYVLSMAVF